MAEDQNQKAKKKFKVGDVVLCSYDHVICLGFITKMCNKVALVRCIYLVRYDSSNVWRGQKHYYDLKLLTDGQKKAMLAEYSALNKEYEEGN